MREAVIYVDTSEIRPGKLEELEAAATDLARALEAREPQLVSYGIYFDDAATTMSVVHVHRDAGSLALHMEVGGPLFTPFTSLLELRSIDVYGPVPDSVLAQLRGKAEMLGGEVRLHARHAGFARLATA